MKPEHISNLVATISAIIAVIAIVVSTSKSEEIDRIDLENRISALESTIKKKSDLEKLTENAIKINNLDEKINDTKQQLGAKADIKDVVTKGELIRLETAWDKKISGKTDLPSVTAIIDPLRKRISEAESKFGKVSQSLSSTKATLESQLASKTTAISHSNPRETSITGNLVTATNKWDGTPTRKEAGKTVVRCPDGWYVVGIGGIDRDGGGYCADCLTHIEFYCRQL